MTSPGGSRLLSLEQVRADGWHERLAAGSPAFSHLCEAVGERFVAFSIVAGVRIAALSIDRHVRDASLVEFTVGNDTQVHRLPLGDFRLRITESLLNSEEQDVALPQQPSAEDLQSFLGLRTVLLAAVFGLSPRQLELTPAGDALVHARQSLAADGEEDIRLPLADFRQRVRGDVQRELDQLQSQSRLAIDLEVLPAAKLAMAQGKPDKVVNLLQTWPALLGIMMRTQELQALPPPVLHALGEGMALLSQAYAAVGQSELAESVLRFGVQWAQGTQSAGIFYQQLGVFLQERGRHGEAIGVLRRALVLGAVPAIVLPSLAACFVGCGRFVAAAGCLLDAEAAGASAGALADAEAHVAAALAKAWPAMRRAAAKPA